MISYETFCDPEEVEVYKRVKRISMTAASVGRAVAAEMVGGVITPGRAKKFVETKHGKFRLSLGDNADNTTEQAAHERLSAEPVVMGDRVDLGRFFEMHGLPPRPSTAWWLAEVKRRLNK